MSSGRKQNKFWKSISGTCFTQRRLAHKHHGKYKLMRRRLSFFMPPLVGRGVCILGSLGKATALLNRASLPVWAELGRTRREGGLGEGAYRHELGNAAVLKGNDPGNIPNITEKLDPEKAGLRSSRRRVTLVHVGKKWRSNNVELSKCGMSPRKGNFLEVLSLPKRQRNGIIN